MPQRVVSGRGRSRWAPRCAILSTVALVACFALSGVGRSLFAFLWVCLALTAMGLEWNARRAAVRTATPPASRRATTAPVARRPPSRRRR